MPEPRPGAAEFRSADVQPILPGFYPDPTICWAEDQYVIVNSSFEYFPGLPVHVSHDLVEWRPVGNGLTRRSQFRRGDGSPSAGIYGATLRYHDGRFWCVTTNVSDFAHGQILVTAERPQGPWSDPIWIPEAIGIDPDICWDGDRCLLTWKSLDFVTEDGIWQAELDPSTGELSGSHKIWAGSGTDMVEGPHLYQALGHWYLLLAEGGTERGHRINIYRGANPDGPFEAHPRNPLLTRAGTDHPVQNVGHGDLVESPEGDWAMVYLGVRPNGSTPGFHTNGRETFVAGISWVDDWPTVDPERFVVGTGNRDWEEDFSATELHPRWVVPGGEPDAILARRPTGVSISPQQLSGGVLCARPTDKYWTARATVRDAGVFLLRIDDRHDYHIEFAQGRITATSHIGGISTVLAQATASGDLNLRIDAVPPNDAPIPFGHAGPDDIVLSFEAGDVHQQLARIDGRYLSTEVAGGFTGRMIGLRGTDQGSHFLAVSYEALEAQHRSLKPAQDAEGELVR